MPGGFVRGNLPGNWPHGSSTFSGLRRYNSEVAWPCGDAPGRAAGSAAFTSGAEADIGCGSAHGGANPKTRREVPR